ncbi:YfbM family protein [Streptomyces sp. NBC_01304]|uniref:YfbM family protein n=1 Tax=Streptomyces sp. NBC_01304 TaxID=2903818 RepID=UPI002E0FFF52|nr:YfbM family protein [Streptomyces sp. NBC_01304]
MSMVLSFTCVTPEELARALQDPEWAEEFLDELDSDEDRPDNPDGFIEKAWAGIQYLLDAAEAGVDLQMGGLPIDEELLFTGWTAEMVQDAARKLQVLPFEKLAAHYDPARMQEQNVYPNIWTHDPDGECEYLKWHYGTLLTFFEEASAKGSAAIVEFNI